MQEQVNYSKLDEKGFEAVGMTDDEIAMYLETGAGVSPDEEAQGSIMTLITFIAMC